MAHGVLVQSKVMAQNVDSLVRSALAAADLDNGWLVSLPTQNTAASRGYEEVWDAAQPATATLAAMWMVAEPEVNTLTSGTLKFKGITISPQEFYVPAGDVFTVIKPQVGDIITLTADSLAGTQSTNGFVVATNGAYKLTWAASAISGLSYQYLETTYLSIPDGGIGSTQRVPAYKFACVAVA